MVQINYIDLPSIFMAAQQARAMRNQQKLQEMAIAREQQLPEARQAYLAGNRQALQQIAPDEAAALEAQTLQRKHAATVEAANKQAMEQQQIAIARQRQLDTAKVITTAIEAIRANPAMMPRVRTELQAMSGRGQIDPIDIPEQVSPEALDEIYRAAQFQVRALTEQPKGEGILDLIKSDPISRRVLNRAAPPNPGTPEWQKAYAEELESERNFRKELGAAQFGYVNLQSQALRQKMATDREEKLGALRSAEASAESSIATVDQLLKHPSFNALFGTVAGATPEILQGSVDAKAVLDHIQSENFLTGIARLRGTGPISEKEGQAATKAVANLQKRQSPELARQTLARLRLALMRMIEESRRLQQTVGVQTRQTAPGQRPAPSPDIATDDEMKDFL